VSRIDSQGIANDLDLCGLVTVELVALPDEAQFDFFRLQEEGPWVFPWMAIQLVVARTFQDEIPLGRNDAVSVSVTNETQVVFPEVTSKESIRQPLTHSKGSIEQLHDLHIGSHEHGK